MRIASGKKAFATALTPLPLERYFWHLLHGNAGREPGERGRDGTGSVARRWRGWVMSPEDRALTEVAR
ncbi:hypothetical protein D8676_19265 [Mesorhizobium sp. YM1C-6-2]|nr:hypothetical protein D8676_19265 [Mesorhizobium sp. YM1C-6-2]